jgi:hypothetical protein
VKEVAARTREQVPAGAPHGSRREPARQAGISPASGHRTGRASGRQPWRAGEFTISPDPPLTDKIRDAAGRYRAPPATAAVFTVDQKPQIQARQRTAPVLPMLPGAPERRSFGHGRHATIDLFAAPKAATGKVTGLGPPRTGPPASGTSRTRSTGRPAQAWPATSAATTRPHTRHRRRTSGCWPTPAASCPSPRPAPPGSARPSGDPPHCSAAARTAACSARPSTSPPRWKTGSSPGPTPHGPSSGPRPPTRSSTASAATAHASQDRDTSGSLLIRDVEVQAAACRDRVDQGLQRWGRGRRGPCLPPALQRDPGGKPGADRAQRPRPGRCRPR